MLKVSNVHLKFGRTPILNGVDFSVNKGEQLGIIGPNGSGKTTLFNCLSGFLFPETGTITFGGKDITKHAAHEKARLGMGRVFQNFGIFRELTVLQNIVVALEGKKRGIVPPWSARHKRNCESAREYLHMVGLESKENDKAGSLSGGQMRLLEIARAIAAESELFLLDEPTAGVSPKMKGEVEQILMKLRDLGKTVLVIEHDLHFIQRLCERIVVLDAGRVLMDGSPENVRRDPRLQEIYFGHQSQSQSSTAAS